MRENRIGNKCKIYATPIQLIQTAEVCSWLLIKSCYYAPDLPNCAAFLILMHSLVVQPKLATNVVIYSNPGFQRGTSGSRILSF